MIRLLCKKPSERDDILQKRPIILRSLLIVAIPYTYIHKYIYMYAQQVYAPAGVSWYEDRGTSAISIYICTNVCIYIYMHRQQVYAPAGVSWCADHGMSA